MLISLLAFFCFVLFASKSPIVSIEVGQSAPSYLKPRLEQLLNGTSHSTLLHLKVGISPTKVLSDSNGYVITVSSKSRIVKVHGNSPLSLSFGAYDVLKRLGYGWLHPMHPFRPENLTSSALQLILNDEIWEISPLLEFRGSHVHAEHPSELCDVLNGFGANGKIDEKSWRRLLPEVDAYLEWLIANRQNAFEWSLLSGKYFADFDQSDKRLARLREIVSMAKNRSLDYVGIDATFSQTQEHGWRLWRKAHVREADDWKEIRSRLDWLLSAGFDGINSELGKSEMQHESNTTRLLSLLNRTASYLSNRGKLYSLESHISTGQTIPGLPDPTNPSKSINFNWAVVKI